MPTPLNNLVYPFDPTGSLVSNLITGEQQVITAANYRDYHFIVPNYAPFFADCVIISLHTVDDEVRTLDEGIDYICTHNFIGASRGCAKEVFGSISFLDLELAGVITIRYQTLGGVWTVGDAKIAEILADRLHNPRITAWDVVSGMPTVFPPIDHEWDLQDMVGMAGLITQLTAIETAIYANNPSAAITAALAAVSNRIYVTANQNAVAGKDYTVNTTAAAITMTLPATPATGHSIKFIDIANQWATNPLTLNRNGGIINGVAANLVCNVAGDEFIIWFNGTEWKVK